MERYELFVDGYHTPLTAAEIAAHFHAGRLRRNDSCRKAGNKQWRTIDELFPLLKYDSSDSVAGGTSSTGRASIVRPGDEKPALTSALKAGWICLGIGLALSWFFPLANAFFSIAVVTAIVAMCTHQVNRGLVLLLTSFAGIILCAVVFFVLVMGTIGAVALPAMKQADADLKRMRNVPRNSLSQPGIPNTFSQFTAPMPALSQPTGSRAAAAEQSRQRTATQTVEREGADRAQRQASVRNAERQRDRLNAKEAELSRLQESIDWYDRAIRNANGYGGSPKLLSEQRDKLLQQRAELQGY